MKLPPLWKVRRELHRVWHQVRAQTYVRIHDPIMQRRHDRLFAQGIPYTEGAMPLTERIAILVLFQPRGIARSTFFTVEHLVAEGWSVVAITNAPLADADRAALLSRTAALIERPNVGYDFGAYRDGMRWLEQTGKQPDRLILMNDSTWFPLREGDDSLRRMEALDLDLAGHIYKIESSQRHGLDHVESHLLMFSRKALQHPVIKTFWRDYVQLSEREQTILRGEKGISQAVLAAGLKVGALLGREQLHSFFSTLPDDGLVAVMEEMIHHRQQDITLVKDWIAAAEVGQPFRQLYLDWVWTILSNSRQHLVSVTFAETCIRKMGLGFIKKARDNRAHLARMALIRAVEAGRIPPIHPDVKTEIEAAIAGWVPVGSDWRASPDDRKEEVL